MAEIRIASEGGRDMVGESPVWDPRTGTLHWVDIIGKTINTLDGASGTVTRRQMQDFPSAIGLTADPEVLITAFAEGVSLVNLASGEVRHVATLDDDPEGNRLNEGAVGPDGAFYVGTMQTNLNPDGSMRDMDRSSGALYRVGADGNVDRLTEHSFGISNTLAWDEARGRLYFADTLTQTVHAIAWPIAPGAMADLSFFAQTTDHGFPDGSCIDADGYLWNARYAGGCLLRYAPDGSLYRRLELPARNITACAFGGPDHATLYITTAANQLTAEELEDPHQGALLAVDAGVRGPAASIWAGEP